LPRKIVHLIPYDGIGGVEMAAASAEGVVLDDVRLERMFVFEKVQDRSGRGKTFDPLALWRAAGRLVQAKPDLVILSLWRAVLVGLLARLRGCRSPIVLFLHNSLDAHTLDKWATRLAAGEVEAIWADSQQTLDQRLPIPDGKPVRVISFIVERREPVRMETPPPAPDFIFWGRLADQKDPLRSIALFEQIREKRPEATLTLIGPDGGLREEIERVVASRGLAEAVRLTGAMDRAGIEQAAAKASFYLQTSRYEGMALSVIEAMQAGLVPVVTPVGEIASYTMPGETAIWIENTPGEGQAVAKVLELIDKPELWTTMRARSISSFAERPLYRDDIMLAARAMLDELGRKGSVTAQ